MKVIIFTVLIAVAVADRLDNTYLPPGSARNAGGNGNFLNTPFGGGQSASFGHGSPSRNHGAQGVSSRRPSASSQFDQAEVDRLDNKYLPPHSARTAGGNVNFANTGFGGGKSATFGRGSPSRNYGAPGSSSRTLSAQAGIRSPAAVYGSPSSSFEHQAFGNDAGINNHAQIPSSSYGAPSGHHSSSGVGGRFNGVAQSRDAGAAILRLNNENYGDGSYRFDYETQNGISQQEAGELKNAGNDPESSSVRGSYTYTGDDGHTYTVNYLADENGFQPFGEHISEISQAVQTSLQKNAAEAQQGYQYNGQGSGNGAYNRAANRQYLAPNKSGFNQQSGYQY